MKKRYNYLTILSLILLTPLYGLSEDCLYTDSLWNTQKASEKQNLLNRPSFAKMDEDCFIAFLDCFLRSTSKTGDGSSLILFLKQYCESKNSFSPSMLDTFLKKAATMEKGCSSADIVKVWEKYNGPIRYRFVQLEERGLYPEADTLYNILYSLSTFDVYDLLKWAEIKGILGDHRGGAKLFCDISQENNNLAAVARSQFAHQLETAASSEIQRIALDIYKKCYLKQKSADTLSLSYWLCEMYDRFKLFREEVNVITEMDRDPKSKGQRLLGVAHRRFVQNLFPEAIPPALVSWKYISAEYEKQTCAIILYRSYSHIGKIDSSLTWLKKIKLSTDQNKTDAIILYQKSGMFEKADSIIQTLVNPVTRDTLTIRQFLFKRTVENAYSFASTRGVSTHWKAALLENYLWKIRTASYCGMLQDVTRYLDSLNALGFSSSWLYSTEILDCRMAVSRLESYPEAFAFWGRLSYFTYINKPQESVVNLHKTHWPLEIKEYCVTSLIEALIQQKRYDTAKYVMEILPELSGSLKINYFHALVDFNLGYMDNAKALFEKIILSDPEDIYTDKARIYLLKLKEFQNR